MGRLLSLLTAIYFGCSLVSFAASTPSLSVEERVQKCMDSANKNNLDSKDWYNVDTRCASNRSHDHGQARACESTVRELKDAAANVKNTMDSYCRENAPEFWKNDHCFGSQQACLERQQASLIAAQKDAERVKAAVEKFKKAVAKVRDTAGLWVEKELDALESAAQGRVRGIENNLQGKQNNLNEKFLQSHNGQPINEVRRLQAALNDPAKLSAFESGISLAQDAAKARRAGNSSYDKAWEQVSNLKSPILQEQFTNLLDAKEMEARFDKFTSELDHTQASLKQMYSINQQTLTNLGTYDGGSGRAIAAEQKNAERNGGNETTDSAGMLKETGLSAGALAKAASSEATKSSTEVSKSSGAVLDDVLAESEKRTAADTKSSRERQEILDAIRELKAKGLRGTALREALRKRLAGNKGEDGTKALARDGKTDILDKDDAGARSLASVDSGGADHGFLQEILGEGFSLGDDDGQLSREMASLLEDDENKDGSILGLESEPLFERVKHVHERCERRGCVAKRGE